MSGSIVSGTGFPVRNRFNDFPKKTIAFPHFVNGYGGHGDLTATGDPFSYIQMMEKMHSSFDIEN